MGKYEAEDTERVFYWLLAGAAFLQIGTWSARYSYLELLWMQQEQSRLECRSESILQETFKKYPLDSNPRELLIATGSKPASKRHLKDLYQEMILNNFCVATSLTMFQECNIVRTATHCLSLAMAKLKQSVAVQWSLMSWF